jgi:hypothetical protein
MKMINFNIFLVSILWIPTLLWSEEIGFGSGQKIKWSEFKRSKISITKVETNKFRLELTPLEQPEGELHLDFENKKANLLKDKNENYSIDYAQYTVVDGKAPNGKRYASFTTRDSHIRVNTVGAGLLGEKVINTPFYFSFFVMPGELEQNSKIFYKDYITGSKRYGIECKIVHNKIEINFNNLFYYKTGMTKSYSLKSQDKLKSKEWTHVVIAVDPNSSSAELFENGIQKDQFFATVGANDPSSMFFGFHENDTNPLVIGRDYYGKLDNFILGRGKVSDVSKLTVPFAGVHYEENVKFPSHRRGNAISPVIKTKYSHSLPIQLQYDAEIPEGTHLEILYRLSGEPFEEDSSFPEWKHYEKIQFQDKMKLPTFQYFQWKVIMRSNYAGTLTPGLTNLKFTYLETVPPQEPYNLRVSQFDHDNLKVCLSWNSNHEKNVIFGGGYMIHYGLSPERMLGTLKFTLDGSKITGKSLDSQKNYKSLEQCIDNSLIQFNALFTKDKNLPVFRSGITYYFKISAYNDKYPFALAEESEFKNLGYDQKSKLSQPVLFTFRTEVEKGN